MPRSPSSLGSSSSGSSEPSTSRVLDDTITLRQVLDEAHVGAELLAVTRVLKRVLSKRRSAVAANAKSDSDEVLKR